jgi:hypothetical protein
VALVNRARALCQDPWVRATLPRNTSADLERRRVRLEAKIARAAARPVRKKARPAEAASAGSTPQAPQ